ncbi:unnamed protein product [Effrenium voratum]|nr:unnamed protein product [Effrenium voratum]
MSEPELDPCVYDVSECGSVSQGSTCRVRCKVPYLGASSVALCPASGSLVEENLTFQLPNCVPSLEEGKVSCPNPASIPAGYRQVQETGGWACSTGYHGEALRQCTLLYQEGSCVLQAVFSGCRALTTCRAADPPIDYPDLAGGVPSCGYDTSRCQNVLNGESCRIGCRAPFSGPMVTARCPATNTDSNQKLTYEPPKCEKLCPSPSLEEAGPGYLYDVSNDAWSCAPAYAGEAVKMCEIDNSCQRSVWMSGCLLLVPCEAPNLDPCRYDWSSCGDLAAGTECQIGCKPPYEGENLPALCPANNSQLSPLIYQAPWCNLNCPDPLPLPEGYSKLGTDFKCVAGYTGFADRTCSVNPDCSYEVTLRGCDKLVGCKGLPELPAWPAPGNRCELDISDCQRQVPLGGSCEARCLAPFTGAKKNLRCPTRNTDPERTVDFSMPGCSLADCPEPVPRGYAKTAEAWRCAPGFGGTVLSSCTTCGRLVLSGCSTAIPCRRLEVEDSCRYNVSDCSESMGAGESCTISCGNAYKGEDTIGLCPADNIEPDGEMVAELPDCQLYCSDPDPMPAGYDLFVDYLGRREFRCAAGYIGRARSECLLLEGCSTELRLTGCIKLEPCTPLQLPHSERYDMAGCDRVMPGQSCRVSCAAPWSGPQAFASCPENNVDASQPLLLPEDFYMDRFGVVYNRLWPPLCSLRCDSIPPGYEKVYGQWRCANGFLGTAQKGCGPRGACREAIQLEGCSQLLPCTIPDLDACQFDVSGCGGFQRGTSCEVKCRAPYNGTSSPMFCPVNNTETQGGLVGEMPDCEIEACADPDVIPPGYVRIDGRWACAAGFTGLAEKRCVAENPLPVSEKQARLDQYGLEPPNCLVRGYLTGCVVAEPCAALLIEDSCKFSVRCDMEMAQEGLVVNSLAAGQSCEVVCKPPYKAASSFIQCPATNTNSSTPPAWQPQICELDCPEVKPPEGYQAASAPG